jgi:hypothetical protein
LTISKAFVNACNILWANNIQNDKVLLVVTDQASYMLKPCEHLKINFPNLNHITCLAHCLNRVCEKIRVKFKGVNSLISNIKKNSDQMFAKMKSFFAKKSGLKVPKYPCITRWGTWLNTAFYYKNNYNKVKSFILELNDESIAIKHIKKNFRKNNKTRSFVNILL